MGNGLFCFPSGIYHSEKSFFLHAAAIALIPCVFFCIPGCREKKAEQENFIHPVQTTVVRTGKIHTRVESIALIKPLKVQKVVARVNGFLTKRNFQEGRFVREGDLLYEIDPRGYEIERMKAAADLSAVQADLRNAKIEFDRAQTLYQEKAAPLRRLDDARAQYDSCLAKEGAAKAALAQAELNLSYTHITAPFSGWVGLTEEDAGNYIASPGIPLTELADISKIRVEFHLSYGSASRDLLESLASGKEPDWEVRLVLSGENAAHYPLPGKIRYWDNAFSPETATIAIQAEFENPEHKLLPGMYVTVVLTDPKAREVLLLDRRAIRNEQNLTYALAVGPDRILSLKPLELGEIEGNQAVVKSGLKSGDVLTLAGNPLLRAGSRVRIDNSPDNRETTTK